MSTSEAVDTPQTSPDASSLPESSTALQKRQMRDAASVLAKLKASSSDGFTATTKAALRFSQSKLSRSKKSTEVSLGATIGKEATSSPVLQIASNDANKIDPPNTIPDVVNRILPQENRGNNSNSAASKLHLIDDKQKMLLAKDSILQKQRRRLLVLCAKFCGSSVIIQCIENEIIQAQSCRTSPAHNGQCVLRNEDMSDIVVATCNILKAANLILSCSAAFNCLKYKYTVHQLLLVHQNLSVAPRSVVNKHILYAILEATICGIFVLPFNSYELLSLEGSHGKMSYYRVEYVTALASFLKIFYPLQLLIDNVLDKFNNSLVLRKLAYFNPNTQFALKIIIRNNPLYFAFVSWCVMLGLGAYILRIAEAPAAANAMDYSQMLYLAVVASFTLGYGDVVPKTYVGRTVLAACIAAGLFLIAISIVFMGSFLELKSGERHIVKIYTHAQMMKALENGAASFLTKWLRLMIQKKKRRGKWSVELHWTVLEEVGIWRSIRGRLMLDMRVLNSGRRWGNDVPSSLDLSRDIDVVGVQVGDRSTKQLQFSRRLTALESKFKQMEAKVDAILEVSRNLLIKMQNCHPLVPKRKLTASQAQRGKIYNRPDSTPQTIAAEIMRLPQIGNPDLSPQRQRLQPSSPSIVSTEGGKKKTEILKAIRIDPALASMFESEPSVAAAGKGTFMN